MTGPVMHVRDVFVETARVVRDALSDPVVGAAWEQPSVLEEQLVGGLAGHLARGAVWVVGDYLDAEVPDAPLVGSAGEYFASVTKAGDTTFHRDIRDRGAQVGAQGHASLCAEVTTRLDALATRLGAEPDARLLGVAGGVLTMRLDDYLETRIVEQVVHLDDLARSVGREPWAVPVAAQDVVLHVGVETGSRRHGFAEMLRCLYRTHLEPALPVL